METNHDVVIIGGGLAGLTAGIHLSKAKLSVMIIEKSFYPRHKVCGEYISNEILSYLEWLDIDISELHPAKIDTFQLTTLSGNNINAKLPLGGFGISRHTLDHFLCKKALSNGCKVLSEQVTGVSFNDEVFTIMTSEAVFSTKVVLGAYGKRSNVDLVLGRAFVKHKSPWLAVKAHYKGNFHNNIVALHNFSGGYCGVSKVENDILNICYLADYTTFKKHKNIEDYQRQVLYKNKHLKNIFENSTMVFDKPLTISQICFDEKTIVENHILMIGDTAGLIHPLCGNGMAMAIHSAKIASELVVNFNKGIITSRKELEKKYIKEWNRNFGKRMHTGKLLAKALQRPAISRVLFSFIFLWPRLLDIIIRRTHGKPIQISN
ncbi:NAD(P)/FAD-dependent oxidoreductase [Flavobacterium cerinum]|uniref:FAD-binding protein n=1 Tax=Flavobacterium cerinum TaxID=2502784 RepID=A0A444HAM2_9FLAO|nr:FAD-dependent oxidoreductase [Flavobacterium cerinum]RWX00387.1 FAD-binding protein [Flavobacterium cerinum]